MKHALRILLSTVLLFFSFSVSAQVSGTVYLDINNSGTRTIATAPFEPGVFGVTVRAFNTAGVQVGIATTDANGAYSLPGVTSFPVRLEFTTPTNLFSGKRTTANNSNVQFIAAATTTADYAVGYHTMFSNNANPWTATNAAINGDPNAGGLSGLARNLYVQEYTFDNTPVADGPNYDNRWLGSVFGLTYQRETRTLLIAAYLKRHIGFGPGGIDAIYRTNIDASGVATQPSILLELANLGINVGTDPRTGGANPIAADSATPNRDLGVFGQVGKRGIGNIDLAENGRDLYVTNLFENKVHRINIGMPVKTSFTAADVTGTWTITGPTLSGSEEWHIMGIKYYQGKVYVGGVRSRQRTDPPVATTADLNSDHTNLTAHVYELDPVTGTQTEVLQFPFNYRRGFCNSDLRYEFKNNYWRAWQNNGDADVLRNDFNDALEQFPQPGPNFNTGNNTGIYYPQPLLADIEFDVDGSMLLGIRDRFGDQTGFNNYLEGANGALPTTDGRLFRGLNSGEILRAGKGGTTWTLETNASVTTNSVITNTNDAGAQGTPPAGAPALGGSWNPATGTPFGWSSSQGFGPGGRYYYYNHSFSATGVPVGNIQDGTVSVVTSHYVKSNGGMALFAGYDEMIHTAMDPDGIAFASGLLRFANKGQATGTNAGNMTDQMQLLPAYGTSIPSPPAYPGTMGKSNGLGDVELLQEAMPIEIGNRIWNDLNGDGIQDANEPGIGSVTVILRSPGADGVFGNGDDQTWTTTTDANGNYYFDNTASGGNVNDSRATALGYTGLPTGNTGILNNQNYRIEIDPAQANLANFRITAQDVTGTTSDNIDNDGAQSNLAGVGTRVFANVNTSNNDYNYDFGFKQLAAIGDKVWRDDDKDGIQDAGEPGVAGVTVTLYNSSGNVVATTVTDAYGNYLFDNLQPGTYQVGFTPPANYTFTIQTNDNDNTVITGGATAANGSDVNSTTGRTANVVLTAGELERNIDAGIIFTQPATNSIGDRVWFDADGDGIQDANEAGVSGVTVTLYASDGVTVIATTVTDANGNYLFSGLPANTNYILGITPPAAMILTTSSGTTPGNNTTNSDFNTSTYKTAIVNTGAAGTQITGIDAGLIQQPATAASLGDRVWNDLDNDGIQDAGEPGVAGVTVTLYASNGTTVVATTVTDAFGNYIFNNLAAGTYQVGFGTAPGFVRSTNVNTGSNDYVDNDASATTGRTGFYTLSAGQRNLSVDAALVSTSGNTASIGDFVWFDTDKDGVQDAGEPGVGGVTVTLYNSSGTAIATTTTDANGKYLFPNLAAGTYSVGFSNLPSGYSFTTGGTTSSGSGTTNSDVNPGTGRTGTFALTAGQQLLGLDAGLIAGIASGLGSIGNKVWWDVVSGNNIQDPGEPGVPGVTVTLLDYGPNGVPGGGDDGPTRTTTTNALGEYIFTGLPASNYVVQFSNLPAGSSAVTPNVGSDDTVDSDGGPITGGISTTGVINLGAGEDNLTIDFGIVNTTRAAIGNRVWFDNGAGGGIANDGIQNGGEIGVAGVMVTLVNANRQFVDINGAVTTTPVVTTTDANGYYAFANLAPGTAFAVRFTNLPDGFIFTTQAGAGGGDDNRSDATFSGYTGTVTTVANTFNPNLDAGIVSPRAALGNRVWLDDNGNGTQDAGEPGVAGVTVTLYRPGFGLDGIAGNGDDALPVASMITDQNGNYLFSNLVPGTYEVEFSTIPGGLVFTRQNSPGDNGNDTNSDANPTTGRTTGITLTASEVDLTVDAGLFKPRAVIGNYVWVDTDNDGIQDANEPPAPGILVRLLDSGGNVVAVAVTDANGNYLFPNVAPGTYSLSFGNLPTGVNFTTPNQGGDDELDSDVIGTSITGIVVTTTTVNLSYDAGLTGFITLPVNIQLIAQKQGTSAVLTWLVSAERDVLSYTLERSTDGRNFVGIYTVNSSGASRYNKIDVQPQSGNNYYRVKVTNLNGSVEYSEIRIVRFDSKGQLTIFPNPATDRLNIQLPESWQGKAVQISLYNQAGQMVLSQNRSTASQVEGINLGQLPAGIYNLRLVNENGEVEVRQVKKG